MFYVYAYYNKETDIVFYVGKGTGRRYKVLHDRNDLFTEYYNNNPCDVKILEYFEKEDDAFDYEQKMISFYKEKGECFCNKDFGGLGGCAGVWTEEKRAYQSANNPMKDENQKARMRENNPMKKEEVMKKNLITRHGTFLFYGEEYYEYKTCAKKWGIHLNTLSRWINEKIEVEKIIPDPENPDGPFTKEEINKISVFLRKKNGPKLEEIDFGRDFSFLGVVYHTYEHARRELGITAGALKNWMTKENEIKEKMPELWGRKQKLSKEEKEKLYHIFIGKNKEVLIDNKIYPSLKEASAILGIKYSTLRARILSNSFPTYCYLEDNQQPSQENSQ